MFYHNDVISERWEIFSQNSTPANVTVYFFSNMLVFSGTKRAPKNLSIISCCLERFHGFTHGIQIALSQLKIAAFGGVFRRKLDEKKIFHECYRNSKYNTLKKLIL